MLSPLTYHRFIHQSDAYIFLHFLLFTGKSKKQNSFIYKYRQTTEIYT